MYLKNLTALGFKSFADKTSLNFQPGITAIVGPNGCGKSNVADSLRWVLGEQSAKALRGGEMADVIFNGTDRRKPYGMAEVSVTIGDVDEEHLKAAGIELSYNEVTITRRVFRDGSSEYFINKTPCRLKDIQQLFMGTGVGRSSYSIMAQGHITQLLSSRPDDRRMVFEEAAGITRFKSQKKDALRKLESTDQNLLRISDLIREVKRQIGSLQRQAGKARRFKEFQQELQHLETQLARHQFDLLNAEIREKQALAEKLRIEMEVCSESLLREEDQMKQLRERLAEQEQKISLTMQSGMELKNQIEQQESKVRFNEERLLELEQRNAKALGDIAQGEERKLVAQQELEATGVRLNECTLKVEELRQVQTQKREALQAVENSLRARQEALRQTQSEAFSLGQQLSRTRNEMNALEMQKQGNAARLEKLSSEKIQLEEERLRLENRLREFASNVEAEKVSVQARRLTVAEKQQRLKDIQQELTVATRQADELLRQQAGSRSRLNVLEQLQSSHEGFSAGALAALKQSPHLLGALVDKIRVPEKYIAAVEAALGHNLQLVLAEQPGVAEQVLADLKANRRGRASIAPLALFKDLAPAFSLPEAAPKAAGVEPVQLAEIQPVAVPAVAAVPSVPTPVSAPEPAPVAPEVTRVTEAESATPVAVTDPVVPSQTPPAVEQTELALQAEPVAATPPLAAEPAVMASEVSAPVAPAAPVVETAPAPVAAPVAAAVMPALAAPVETPAPVKAGAILALSVVEGDEAVRPLLQRLLGRTLIVPELAQAAAVWREHQGECDVVTLSGEVLSRFGVMTGGAGSGSDKAAASILGRKNQILELQVQLAQLQEQVNEASRKKGALQGEQSALQASLQEEQTELRTQEVAIATHQGEFKALENSLRLLHQKVDTVVYEIQTLSEREQESQGRIQALAGQVGELQLRETELQERLAEGNAELEDLRQQRDAANNGLTENKVALATEEQLANSLEHQQRNHEQRLQELTAMVDARRGEISSLLERRGQFESQIQESRLHIESLQHERDLVNQRATELHAGKQELEKDLASRDEILRERRRRLTELQQQRSALEVELAQKQMSAQNLSEKILQKYQLKLDEIRGECITITIADEGPAKVTTLTPEEMAAQGVATDWVRVAEQVAALQQKLDEIGPVNLVAIEEYEETEQRYQFLNSQSDDLVKAKEQLLEVITRINNQTREMFTETFNKIRENFATLFTEVFGGGKADLILVNDGDVLESGIDIMAKPPGKQLKSITLLSGGEQTMTAVALLFAIYQVKPSPFCVLDELDAPLDESNINRFIGVLKRFLERSQFIMITHNKRTIAMADVIYGVTMQEHGVSKMLSMKFHKSTGTLSEQPLAAASANPGQLPPPPAETGPAPLSVADAVRLAAAPAAARISLPEPAKDAKSDALYLAK
jgi:chromosome segregation protein